MTDTLYVYTMCPHDEPLPHPVGECPQAGKEMILRQVYHHYRGPGDGAHYIHDNCEPYWVEVNDD